MINSLRKLALAASYVTSLSCLPKPESEAELAGLSKYLPTVGIFLGAILASTFYLCQRLHAGLAISAFLVVAAWLGITGCIHMDGLMDAADGIFSHRHRDKMLEIMRDSRVGNFGAISGVLIILAKLAALYSLPSAWILPSLLLVPVWSRWVEVFAIASFKYARPEGLGKIWHDTTGSGDLLQAAALPGIFTLAVCLALHSQAYSLLIPLTLLPGILFSLQINKILQGHTGDTYGACVEFAESASLVLLSLSYRFLG